MGSRTVAKRGMASGVTFLPALLEYAHGDWSLVFWLHAGIYLLAAACWLAIDTNRSIESPGETDAV